MRLYNNRVLEAILNFAIFVAALSYATFESSNTIFVNGECIRCTDFNCETIQTKEKWVQRSRGSCIKLLPIFSFRSIRVQHMYRLLQVLSYFILPLLMTSLIITIQIMIMNRSRDSWPNGCGTANKRKIRKSDDRYILVCESLNRQQYGNLHLRLAIYYLLTSMPECLIQLVNYI